MSHGENGHWAFLANLTGRLALEESPRPAEIWQVGFFSRQDHVLKFP
jgi:hypothetical protein